MFSSKSYKGYKATKSFWQCLFLIIRFAGFRVKLYALPCAGLWAVAVAQATGLSVQAIAGPITHLFHNESDARFSTRNGANLLYHLRFVLVGFRGNYYHNNFLNIHRPYDI